MTTGRLLRSQKETVVNTKFDISTVDGSILKILPKNRRVRSVSIIVDEEFDDPTATISIGTMSDNNLIFPSDENDLSDADEYFLHSNYLDESNQTTIRIYINPQTSTLGKGEIIFKYV
jgi:hypothetical protein